MHSSTFAHLNLHLEITSFEYILICAICFTFMVLCYANDLYHGIHKDEKFSITNPLLTYVILGEISSSSHVSLPTFHSFPIANGFVYFYLGFYILYQLNLIRKRFEFYLEVMYTFSMVTSKKVPAVPMRLCTHLL